MLNSTIFLAADILIFALLYFFAEKREKNLGGGNSAIYVVLGTGFVARCFFGYITSGYQTDMSCWSAWGERAFTYPLTEFYTSDSFCDYPPLYMYVLYITAFIRHVFSLSANAYTLLLKLPAILADMAIGYMLYRLFAARNKKTAFIAAAFCALNPAAVFDSAVWGQIDSVMLVPLIASFYLLYSERYVKSALLLAVSVLTKPQALIFAPFYFLEFVEKFKTDKKLYLKKLLLCIASFLGGGLILILPFIIKKPPFFIFELFGKTLSSYSYASLNAFNLFALFSGNGVPLTNRFLFVNYGFWGTAFTILSLIFCGYIFLRGRDKSKIFYCSALFMTLIYMLGAKVHERYLLPAIFLYFITYMLSKNRRVLFISLAYSVTLFINIAAVYTGALNGNPYVASDDTLLIIISLINVAITVYAVYTALCIYAPFKTRTAPVPFAATGKRITRADIIIMSAVTALYAAVAFSNLGDIVAPEVNHEFRGEKNTVAAFESPTNISSAMLFKGLGDGKIQIIASNDGRNWSIVHEIDSAPCFAWTKIDCNFTAKYIGIDAVDANMELCEMAFYDTDGAMVSLRSTSPLFDEQDKVPKAPSFKNSTYFDEIYHARTAYEHIHLIPQYETTHPPLGKLIIGIGIRLFGMNPFGWRFMGTLFGTLMLPLIYLFAKRMFKNTHLAALAIILFAADFMHFAQTRIATIDTYGVFFIMLMYYFMYIYYDSTGEELPFKKSLAVLLLSGISFGLGAASKWICLYAAVGLAVLFFMAIKRRYTSLRGECFKTLLFCVAAFVIIPFVIYSLSYIPVYLSETSSGFFKSLWGYQKHMFSYHSNVTATHPFSSKWYQWPGMSRPIWYYGTKEGELAAGKVTTIVSLGNPLVWWGGTICMLYFAYRAIARRDKTALFIFIGFLSQYLPWCFIGRIVFIYHFFACVPFIILALCGTISALSERIPHKYFYLYGCAAVAIMLFVMFFPVISGLPVSRDYIVYNLKWFPSWVLCF